MWWCLLGFHAVMMVLQVWNRVYALSQGHGRPLRQPPRWVGSALYLCGSLFSHWPSDLGPTYTSTDGGASDIFLFFYDLNRYIEPILLNLQT